MLTVPQKMTLQVAHDFDEAIGKGTSHGLVTTEEWDALLHTSPSDVVFMTWQWQRVWWQHFGSQAQEGSKGEEQECCKLHLLSVRAEDGALLGLAPLFIVSEPLPPLREYQRGVLRPVGEGKPLRLVRLVGGVEIADYLDVLASPDDLP